MMRCINGCPALVYGSERGKSRGCSEVKSQDLERDRGQRRGKTRFDVLSGVVWCCLVLSDTADTVPSVVVEQRGREQDCEPQQLVFQDCRYSRVSQEFSRQSL